MQIGFARAFCDIHCVRDAVIRGDRSIIRNLELATKKTNNNMAALMKWSVEAARTETGWLADKMDYSHAINVAYLQDIHNVLTGQTQGTEEQLVEQAAIATSKIFEEMQGYAEARAQSAQSSGELIQEFRKCVFFFFFTFFWPSSTDLGMSVPISQHAHTWFLSLIRGYGSTVGHPKWSV